MTTDPKNSKLYNKIKAFVITALEELSASWSKHLKPFPISKTSEIVQIFTPSAFKAMISVDRFVYDHRVGLKQLPEFINCIQLMQMNAQLAKNLNCLIGSGYFRETLTEFDYLAKFLIDQLKYSLEPFNSLEEEIIPLKFNFKLFEHTYFEIERFFYNDSIIASAIASLHNFIMEDVEEINLGEGLRIRRTHQVKPEYSFDEIYRGFQRVPDDIPKYIVEFTYEVKKEFGEDLTGKRDIMAKERLEKLVTGLRLFKPGLIIAHIIQKQYPHPWTSESGAFGELTNKPPRGYLYHLEKSEARKFQQFWDWFHNIDLKQRSRMNIAIRRFNDAQERDRLDDKLVDFMIAFEMLFFKKRERGGITHKLAVRTARLLENKYEARKNLMKLMATYYSTRNKIVHGEEPTIDHNIVFTVETYLRKAIISFLKRLQGNEKHDDIITQLDLD